ncbi:hypothetical protein C8J57DRAFT_1239299 [Mycena rebaudengoi]|nr:hypothetical protein C8J57DRAFT_1239299 [Mycena rebaudengoi]
MSEFNTLIPLPSDLALDELMSLWEGSGMFPQPDFDAIVFNHLPFLPPPPPESPSSMALAVKQPEPGPSAAKSCRGPRHEVDVSLILPTDSKRIRGPSELKRRMDGDEISDRVQKRDNMPWVSARIRHIVIDCTVFERMCFWLFPLHSPHASTATTHEEADNDDHPELELVRRRTSPASSAPAPAMDPPQVVVPKAKGKLGIKHLDLLYEACRKTMHTHISRNGGVGGAAGACADGACGCAHGAGDAQSGADRGAAASAAVFGSEDREGGVSHSFTGYI